jgi:TonB family protein
VVEWGFDTVAAQRIGGAMKKGWVVLAVVLVMGSLMAGSAARGQNSGKYHAAGIAQAGDVAYPMDSKAPGFVTLDVSLDATGAMQNVTVVRDVPPLTDAAQNAVKSWQFTPAMVNGQGVPGVARVTVAFNPFNPSGVGLPGESLQPATGAGTVGNFQPAGLKKANYAVYPPNMVAGGTVVLQVHVGSEGKVHGVVVVQGKAGLTGAATAAAKTWVFTAAQYEGKAVRSDVGVVFVFAGAQAGTR